jgi:hypothetical protein
MWLYDVVTSKPFDTVMFVLIILNCAAMVYEYPTMHKDAPDGQVLFWRCVVALCCQEIAHLFVETRRPVCLFISRAVQLPVQCCALLHRSVAPYHAKAHTPHLLQPLTAALQ